MNIGSAVICRRRYDRALVLRNKRAVTLVNRNMRNRNSKTEEAADAAPSTTKTPDAEPPVSREVMEAMGLSDAAYGEVCAIIGHNPTADELSTLLAMWQTSGMRQGLFTWLKGQPHAVDGHDYLLDEQDRDYYRIREPRVRECAEIARRMSFANGGEAPVASWTDFSPMGPLHHHGDAIYMVGDISRTLANSEYVRKYLHLVSQPAEMATSSDTIAYIKLVLGAMQQHGAIQSFGEVGVGGIFGSLVHAAALASLGFDILSYREVRLDAFLFGEERGRCLTTFPQEGESFFLQKMDEARINCCMLGKVTRGRVLVDDMDFGTIADFVSKK